VQKNTSGPWRDIVVSPPFAAFYQATHIPAARKVGNRLLHHAHLVLTKGDSHRLAEALAGKGVIPLRT